LVAEVNVMSTRSDHAVVVGAGMAGLCAARVLAERFARVTVLDRDELATDDIEPRRAVPQGRHAHALLARGQRALDELFPGLSAELVADGAPEGDLLGDYRLHFGGHRLCRGTSGLRALSVSRPYLENRVRRRVAATPGVRLRADCDAVGLETAQRNRVTGVRLVARAPGSAPELIGADLVIDAAGRGSRLPAWLEELGIDPPPQQRIPLGLGYASCRFGLDPEVLQGDLGVIWGPVGARPRVAALALVETGEWLLTVAGLGGDHPPLDPTGMIAFAASLPCPDLAHALRDAEPTTAAVPYRFSAATRRRYDRLPNLPDGLVAIGDGVCSLDPIYGQGMTIAALQAMTLRRAPRDGHGTRALQTHAVAATRSAWGLAAAADRALPGVVSHRRTVERAVARYLDGVQRAGSRDRAVATRFLRVTGLMDRPSALLRPTVLLRVLHAWRPTPSAATPRRCMTARLAAASLLTPLGSLLAAALAVLACRHRRRRPLAG
jgi:2-polyprenyl-6-methoxyphenol hydroxylase-like FAD-dependent oxidoreductase